jgi:2-amino-4-hydroxy-6-hydroxymethyldihydropteridine diphosphokinase
MNRPGKMKYHLGLGSNLGKREKNLSAAILELEKAGIRIIRLSSVYETEPTEFRNQPDFLNMAILIESVFKPEFLLKKLKKIEYQLGRKSSPRNHPRCIDLDILLAENQIMKGADLTIPHPQLHKRKFVLVPLTEISPHFIHPVFQISIKQLLQKCSDTGNIKKLKN